MKTFHVLTIIIASIILTILLIYAAIQSARQHTIYPPIISNCPDLWTVDDSGNCIIPSNPNSNVGNLSGKPLYKYEGANSNFTKSTMTYGYSFLPQIIYNNTTYNGNPVMKNGEPILGYFSYDIPHGFDPRNPTVINFNDPGWGSHGDPNCSIIKWAKQHNITWNGLYGGKTSYVSNC